MYELSASSFLLGAIFRNTYLIVDSRAHECKIESESELCASAPVVARAVLCHPRDEKRRRHSFVSNREKSQPASVAAVAVIVT